jgi:hypothetical protein
MARELGYEYSDYHQGIFDCIDLPADLAEIVVNYVTIDPYVFLSDVCRRMHNHRDWFDKTSLRHVVIKLACTNDQYKIYFGHYNGGFVLDAVFAIYYDANVNHKLTLKLLRNSSAFEQRYIPEIKRRVRLEHSEAAQSAYFDKPSCPSCCRQS